MRILVTGDAGFIGTHLGLALKRALPDATVLALDNLQRRGSARDCARAAGRQTVHRLSN